MSDDTFGGARPCALAPSAPSLDALIAAGFTHTASWQIDADNAMSLNKTPPVEAGIYLFVVDGHVQYVGLASEGLAHRIKQYARKLRRAQGFREVHHGIKDGLHAGHLVHLYTLIVDRRWDLQNPALPIDRLIGLEAGLIEAIDPKWNRFNGAGRKRRAGLSALPATL